MENNIFNIHQEKNAFYTTLSFVVFDKDFTTCMSSVFGDMMKQYSISEDNIVDAKFSRIDQKSKKGISVEIKYYNFDIHELEKLDEAEKIRFALNFMGYPDENIKDISYKKYWSNSNELEWVAKVSDPNHKFDIDESYCERDYELNVHNAIYSVLHFNVYIDFV